MVKASIALLFGLLVWANVCIAENIPDEELYLMNELSQECESIKRKINVLLVKLNHCEVDSDCKIVGNEGITACGTYIHKHYYPVIRQYEEAYSTLCGAMVRGCGVPSPVCENGKCVGK